MVAARDLGLVSEPQARTRIQATLTGVSHLERDHGFLYQWYDTTNGNVLVNPGQGDCTETAPAFDNCFFISNVDNGWYASGLIVVRQAVPELRHLVDGLIAPMNFGLFYDNRAETHCNVNPAIPGNQPTGQMYGGYYAGLPPGQNDNWTHYYHNGALYSDPRISAYIGMGLRQMPGNVWWRSWRELPSARSSRAVQARVAGSYSAPTNSVAVQTLSSMNSLYPSSQPASLSFGRYVGHVVGNGRYGRWLCATSLCSVRAW